MTETTMQPTDAQRRTRLNLCRASEAMRAAVKEIEGDEQLKRELSNMVTATLRLSLSLNDGHLSDTELRAF